MEFLKMKYRLNAKLENSEMTGSKGRYSYFDYNTDTCMKD